MSYLILDFLCDCQDMQIAKKPFAVRVKVKLQNLRTQYDKKMSNINFGLMGSLLNVLCNLCQSPKRRA